MIFRYWRWLIVLGAVGILGGAELVRGQEDGKAAKEAEGSAGKKAEEGEKAEEAEKAEEDPMERFRTKEESFKGKIVVIPVGEHDLISSARFEFMQRIIDRAGEEEASALILDMNTPGGQAWASAQLIMTHLPKLKIPTYTFVNPNAVSAGAIIALGTDIIYMAPTSAIGAAAVVTATGGDLNSTMEDKVTSMLKAQVRSVAKTKGHNPEIAQAFIDKDMEVVLEAGEADKEKYPMGSVVISKKGELLSFDHEQATEIINGKPVLAKGVAEDLEDLIAQEGLEGELFIVEPLGLENFALWVTRMSVLLLALGIAGAYMEMQSPGFGIPGAVGLLCFAIFFFGHFVAGKLAGFEIVAVFVLGLVLVGVEVFLFPGALVFGIAGVVMVLGALLYTMAGTVPGDSGSVFVIDMSGLHGAVMNLSLGMAGAIILVAVVLRYLPETRAMSWLILKTSVAGGASLGSEEGRAGGGGSIAKGARSELVGMSGVTITPLHPSGKGRFEGRVLDVVSDGEFVEAGVPVVITASEGARIVVEAV